jgi:hypothetical protein
MIAMALLSHFGVSDSVLGNFNMELVVNEVPLVWVFSPSSFSFTLVISSTQNKLCKKIHHWFYLLIIEFPVGH